MYSALYSIRPVFIGVILLSLLSSFTTAIFSDNYNYYVIQGNSSVVSGANDSLWYNNSGVITAFSDVDLDNNDMTGINTFTAQSLITTGIARAGTLQSDGAIYTTANGHFHMGSSNPSLSKFLINGTNGDISEMNDLYADKATFNEHVNIDYQPQQVVGLDGMMKIEGNISTSIVGAGMSFAPDVYGSGFAGIMVEPTMYSGSGLQLFRFQPSFESVDRTATLILFSPEAHETGYDDEYSIFQESSLSRQFFQFSGGDTSTVYYNWLPLGGALNMADVGVSNANVTENMITLTGGASRVLGTNGWMKQTGLTFTGFGTKGSLTSNDEVTALRADGGDFIFEEPSLVNVTGTSLVNVPHAEVYNVTENGYTISIGTLNMWHNFTGLIAGETKSITINEGFNVTYAGVYKMDWSVSFSGSGGSTHAVSATINDVEHVPCRSYRKLGTAGDVGNVGGTCIITLEEFDVVRGVVMDINAPAQDIDVWSVNANLMRIGDSGGAS